MAGFNSFPRVTSSSASNLLCLGLDTTGTTTPLDLVRLVGAPLALVKLVGFFVAGLRVLWRVLKHENASVEIFLLPALCVLPLGMRPKAGRKNP